MMKPLCILLATILSASAQVWTNAPPPVTPPGWTNGTSAPPPWWSGVRFDGVVAGSYTTLTFTTAGTNAIQAIAGNATNGVNSTVTIEGTSNWVSLASGTLTVRFKTNYTGSGTGGDLTALSNGLISVGAVATTALTTAQAAATNGQWNGAVAGASNLAIAAYGQASNAQALAAAAMPATGTVGNVTFWPLVITTNRNGFTQVLGADNNTNAMTMQAGPYRAGSISAQYAVGGRIYMYPTNHATAPGDVVISSASLTGAVTITGHDGITLGQIGISTGGNVTNVGSLYAAGTVGFTNVLTAGVTSPVMPIVASLRNAAVINDGQGNGVINNYDGRMDFRSYWQPPFMVYQSLSNYVASPKQISTFWAYAVTNTGGFPTNFGAYIVVGAHDATRAVNGAAFGCLARGTNDYAQDAVFYVSSSETSNLVERARITTDGNFSLLGGKFIGDGSGLTNITGTSSAATVPTFARWGTRWEGNVNGGYTFAFAPSVDDLSVDSVTNMQSWQVFAYNASTQAITNVIYGLLMPPTTQAVLRVKANQPSGTIVWNVNNGSAASIVTQAISAASTVYAVTNSIAGGCTNYSVEIRASTTNAANTYRVGLAIP